MAQVNDLSRSLTALLSTLVVVVGMSRVRETCTYGSMRGASSNGRPYRHPMSGVIRPAPFTHSRARQ